METLPLWPEALERGQRDSGEMHFPSELDEDLELPICASFYSLRGGVGRSTALAYTGRILSAKGRKVVCVDMDLEAPGLASLFGCEQRVEANQGVADLLVQIDRGETPDITGHLIKVSDDDLYCLPAGIASANYARLLRFIDPVAWYREEKNPLRSLIEMLETRMPFKPDAILLDSRTGITSLSGPLLFDLAETINHIKSQIDRTPMPASAFRRLGSQELSTAVEAGLLSVYEGTAENVERYKVPDLFRHALKLTRKGQF